MREIANNPVQVQMLDVDNIAASSELLKCYTGWDGVLLYNYYEELRNSPDLPPTLNTMSPEELMARVDTRVLNYISEAYNVSEDRSRHMLADSLKGSNKLHDSVLERALPYDFKNILGKRNEIAVFPNSVADRIQRVAYKYRDSGERFQGLKQLLTAETFLQLYGNYPEEEVAGNLSGFQDFLNTYLFESGEEATGVLEFSTWHDNKTNEFISLAMFGQECQDCHAKQHLLTTRELQNGANGIHVLTNSRVKDYVTAVEKAWGKAIKNGGKVRPIIDVEDLAGIMFTVVGGVAERDYVVDKMKDIFATYGAGYIEDAIDDDELDGRTQCKQIDWRRLKVQLAGVPYPIEVIVNDLEVYLNNEYYVGPEGDPRKPRAHLEFERDRAATLLKTFFPESVNAAIYGSTDIQKKILDKKEQLKQQLLQRNVIPRDQVLKTGYNYSPLNHRESLITEPAFVSNGVDV